MRHVPPLISLEYISKSYGDDFLDYQQFVLRNISLTVQRGEFIIIFGPSGSGKSTLLHMIAGLEQPTAGKVIVGDRDLAELTEDQLAKYHRLKMGMVFQSFNLIKSLNVWENVALPQTADGVPYGQRFDRAKHLLKLLKVDSYLFRHPNELSGGEQQRVAIARALINDPLLMLVDEPTGNLDTKSADGVMRILHDLHYYSNHTILLVTHNPDYLHYASRTIYVQDGEIKKQEWRQQTAPVMPKLLPDEHYDQLAQYRQVDQAPGSLAPLERANNEPIGSPAKPAGIGAHALVKNQPRLPAPPPLPTPSEEVTLPAGPSLFGEKEGQ